MIRHKFTFFESIIQAFSPYPKYFCKVIEPLVLLVSKLKRYLPRVFVL